MSRNFKVEITPNSTKFNYKELFTYKDLIAEFVKRNFVTIYKQTILGPLWIVLTPIVTSVIFTIIFGGIANIDTNGVPHFLFYLTGTSLWTFFSTTLINISNTFILNAPVFSKVYFPRFTVPISQVITSIFNLLIQIVIIAIVIVFYLANGIEINISLNIMFIPLIILLTSMLSLACGIIVSSLTTRYRDLVLAMNFGIQLWMYLSPVVYPLASTSGLNKLFLYFNPITSYLELYRYCFFGVGEINFPFLLYSISISFILFTLGVKLFNKIERNFVDTI